MFRLRRSLKLVLFVLLLLLVGCGSPTKPTPPAPTPETPSVTPPPAVPVTHAEVVSVIPDGGEIVVGNTAKSTVKWEVVQADRDAATAAGYSIVVGTCLAVQPDKCLMFSFTRPTTGTSGTQDGMQLVFDPEFTPGITETDYVLGFLAKSKNVPPNTQPPPNEIIPETVHSLEKHFIWKK